MMEFAKLTLVWQNEDDPAVDGSGDDDLESAEVDVVGASAGGKAAAHAGSAAAQGAAGAEGVRDDEDEAGKTPPSKDKSNCATVSDPESCAGEEQDVVGVVEVLREASAEATSSRRSRQDCVVICRLTAKAISRLLSFLKMALGNRKERAACWRPAK